MSLRQIVFTIILLGSLAAFGWTMNRLTRVMLRGRKLRGELGGPKEWVARFGDVMTYFFFQRSVAREGLSWHHLPIFWGFLVITVASIEILIAGVVPSFNYELIFGHGIVSVFRGALDFTNLLVLAAVGYAYFRRIVIKPRLIPLSADAALILGMIAALCLSHFGAHGFAWVAGGTVEPSMMISKGLYSASMAAGLAPGTASILAEVNWWAHALILLFFLNYIPYSKHIHLLGALPNILLRNRQQPGVMPKLDLEDETDWGVGRYEQLDWKSLLDTYACTECARCSNSCPANVTGKALSPMHLIHDIRDDMLARGGLSLKLSAGVSAYPDLDENPGEPNEADKKVLEALGELPPLVGGRITEQVLWDCTTCGACEAECPVFIEHPLKIMQMRTHLALEGNVPTELARMFRGIENNQNPWGFGADKRMEWAEGLDLPVLADKGSAEYLVWIGCAGSYDDRAKKISRAWVSLLKEAGVDFAVLGSEEGCTGDSARRAGNEFLFQTMAETNVEALSGYGVKKILTSCPHCFHSFKNEYPAFGGEYEVHHHSEFLAKLVDDGKLTPGETVDASVTYHDACYLGRWNDEYENPRNVIEAVTGEAPKEMPRHGYKSFCCGAGGAHLWMEEEGERVNVNRTEEAVATGADTIATACPFCNLMITDGVKHLNKEEEVRVADIAELLAESIAAGKPAAEEASPSVTESA